MGPVLTKDGLSRDLDPRTQPPGRSGESAVPELAARLALIVASGVFLWLVVDRLAPRLRFEDALIVLRYARNIVAGEGFVFNPGERVLAVSTPLHTLLSTLYVWLSPDGAPMLQNIGGALSLIALAWVVLYLVREVAPPWLALVAALLILADLNFNHLYLGMEVHLFAALVMLALLLFVKGRDRACGLVLGLAFLTRYDAALLAVLVGAWLLVERQRPPLRLLGWFLVPVAPWLVFAWLYFGSALATPLAAKRGFVAFAPYLEQVFWYYKATFARLVGLYLPLHPVQALVSWLFPALLGVGAWVFARQDRRWLLLALYPVLHLAVYAAIGADPGFHWHYWILNPAWLVLFGVGCHHLAREAARRVVRPDRLARLAGSRILGGALAVVVLAPLLLHELPRLAREHRPSPLTVQLETMGRWLRAHYGEKPSLLQPAIGILGWETNMPMVDHAGLVTPGLYFFDDDHCTPLDQVLARHHPDLVLLRADAEPDLAPWGYAPVRSFQGHFSYYLFERQGW